MKPSPRAAFHGSALYSALSCALLWAAATAMAQDPIRIYISADMEGVAGVVDTTQTVESGMEYQRFRELMTEEVLAAIEGARSAGATEFLVSDSHGNKHNLLIERFPDDVRIIRGGPRPLMMMEGLEQGGFDGVFFLGYHASASHWTGVQAHSFSGGTVAELYVNGIAASEGLINAAVAGELGVPVLLISGDDAAVEELAAELGAFEQAVVKRAINARAAETLTPAAARALIRDRAAAAVRRIGEIEPFVIAPPIVLDLHFRQAIRAELMTLLPYVERTERRAIRFRGESMIEVHRFLRFAITYPG